MMLKGHKTDYMRQCLTMAQSLKREKSMIFPQDFSERTLLAVAHSRNCIETLEKQIPKEPLLGGNTNKRTGDIFICPSCSGLVGVDDMKAAYCADCGQALSWGK